MKKSRFTESQIVAVLKEGEAGMAPGEISCKHGISRATYFNWRSKYGGVTVNELKRMKELEAENRSSSACTPTWHSRTRQSRTYFPENCNAVRETAGRRGVRERASAVDPARLPHPGTVPDVVLPSPDGRCGTRRRGDRRAQRDRRQTAAVGLLEVLRPDAPRWASVESQAGASCVLRATAESAATDQAPGAGARSAAARCAGGLECRVVTGLRARRALRRAPVPHAQRARRR